MKLHVDPSDVRDADILDPKMEDKVTALIATALQLGGNPGTAAILLMTALTTFAEQTDCRGCILTVAWSMIDDEIGEAARRAREEAMAPDEGDL